ncbi:Predicted PurR-regulated permease PerM [Cribrihabitans marinus]|uniref:Predicted PurR-regulated permease PerM n=1 Tax=Cribrihabitans marinus TaxID=1227549 RepID=A0A1H6ZI83_9RHOB|nr:AI-2E family transporter [Cribrihabitans marinus]GGH30599.1 AI-2E family transporter [Cribrihabitans marinus]SEJ53139.1 Predicted PurR-regulated permease PerM [Cribrihabitans marinus]
MALPTSTQFRYWGIATAIFVVVMWFLGDVLLPFIIGSAIAYFVDPVADRLESWGLSRVAATFVITVASILVVVILLLAVVPALITQMVDLANTMPQLFQDLRGFINKHFPSLLDQNSEAHKALTEIGQTLKSRIGDVLKTVLGSAASAINVVVLLVIVPVVSVYMLLDWDRMIGRIDQLLPRDHAPVIRQLATDIDRVLASFVRGMGTVCLILGTYYAVALMAVGLQFGLVVGFIAGLVTFIPYLGALIGGLLAIGLALFQFWGSWGSIALVAGIFAIGQVVEGNFLTPKLVGNSVGLHPVWLLLALSVFGSMFGFVGMLVAVPVAAALGVLARFGTEQYLQSRLYKGLSEQDAE